MAPPKMAAASGTCLPMSYAVCLFLGQAVLNGNFVVLLYSNNKRILILISLDSVDVPIKVWGTTLKQGWVELCLSPAIMGNPVEVTGPSQGILKDDLVHIKPKQELCPNCSFHIPSQVCTSTTVCKRGSNSTRKLQLKKSRM